MQTLDQFRVEKEIRSQRIADPQTSGIPYSVVGGGDVVRFQRDKARRMARELVP